MLAPMDRIAPSRRPEGRNAGTQRWRDLLFIHWPVPEALVRPLIPERLGLDLYDGVLYVGIVPFAMFGVRPDWLPGSMDFDFLETNLRTYVHLDGDHPGVWFFSLEAASWLAVQAAKSGFGLPYHHASMTMRKESGETVYETIRRSGSNPRFFTRYSVGDYLGPSEPGSLQHFLLERYHLYAQHGGKLQRGTVHHEPYAAHAATVHEVHDELMYAAGLPDIPGPPPVVHYSPGVDVEVFALQPV